MRETGETRETERYRDREIERGGRQMHAERERERFAHRE